jgi:phosphoribosylformimino-5-aminoimidazole carboxamide ribotide isomerase
MDILPAIDLLGGRCVRLIQGRYDRVIQYESDPLDVARRFRDAGATWIHVVDLDGARNGRLDNLAVVRDIIARTGAQVEFGGGIRDEAAIRAALDAGAGRVIIGTRALEDWDWFRTVVHQPAYAGRIALGLDARVGMVTIRGRTQDAGRQATEVAADVRGWPLAMIVYTDIGRDGLLLGPNIHAIETLAAASPVRVGAAGGVSDLEDVRRLAQIKLAEIVIGRAIYEGAIQLTDALAVARGAGA